MIKNHNFRVFLEHSLKTKVQSQQDINADKEVGIISIDFFRNSVFSNRDLAYFNLSEDKILIDNTWCNYEKY